MANYAVLNKDGVIRGLIPSKEYFKKFKEQRQKSIDYYTFHKVNDQIAETMVKEFLLVEYAYGMILFQDEFEMVGASHSQYLMESQNSVEKLAKCVNYLNVDNEERKILETFLKDTLDILYDFEEALNEDGDVYVEIEEKYFDMQKFVKVCLSLE